MVSVASVKNLQLQVALAERQVARDQSQVDADQATLDQSQALLDSDTRQLNGYQDQQRVQANQRIAANTSTVGRVLDSKPPVAAPRNEAQSAPAKPSVNAQGEAIGQLIHVTA